MELLFTHGVMIRVNHGNVLLGCCSIEESEEVKGRGMGTRAALLNETGSMWLA